MVRPVEVFCRVWWAISLAFLSILRLLNSSSSAEGVGDWDLRPRSPDFAAYQGVLADVGLRSST